MLLLAFPAAPNTKEVMRVVGWREAGFLPSIYPPVLWLHMYSARLWHPNAAMATDCDVSNPGPGTHTTLGCQLIERWVYHLRQGWTAALGPCCQPEGRLASRPCPGVSLPSHSSLRAPVRAVLSPFPLPQRTDASCRFLSWVSILVILFCFLKIPPACSSRWRRCSLAVPFFKSDLLAGELALAAVSDLAVCP